MSGPSKTETKNEPWAPAQPSWLKLISEGNAAYDATSKTPFEGDYYAGPSDAFRTDLASSRDLARRTQAGDFLSPESNPFLAGAINAAINPVKRTLQESILPGIDDAAISSGAYGGARQGVEQNKALVNFDEAATDATSRISYDNYLRERQNQQGATNTLLGLGTTEQNWAQGQLASDYQKYQDTQTAPWNGLDKLLQILAGTSGFSTQTTTKSSNPLTEILQALAGGAGLATSFFNPFGAAAGAVLPGGTPLGQGGIGHA